MWGISELSYGILAITPREPSVPAFLGSNQAFGGKLFYDGLPLFGRHSSQERRPLIRLNRLPRAYYCGKCFRQQYTATAPISKEKKGINAVRFALAYAITRNSHATASSPLRVVCVQSPSHACPAPRSHSARWVVCPSSSGRQTLAMRDSS